MDEQQRRLEEERRLHRAAMTRAGRQAPVPWLDPDQPVDEQPEDAEPGPEEETEETEDPATRLEKRALWVDHQIRAAMARGEFDDLPGTGKPIRGIDGPHDPDWWVKGLIEREQITAVLPPALALRKEDAALEERLDRLAGEEEVRRALEDFNRRVVDARRQLQGGPPVVTPTRDADAEVTAWRERRTERLRRRREARAAGDGSGTEPRRGWRRLLFGPGT